MKVLVIRFSALGDVAMTLPAIKNALLQNPTLEITVVSRSAFAAIFASIDRLTFIGINVKEYKGVLGLWKLSKLLFSTGSYNILLDLHDSLRTKFIRLFFKWKGISNVVIDKGKTEKKLLIRRSNKQIKPLIHAVERYSNVFNSAGIKTIIPLQKQNYITLTAKGIESADAFLQKISATKYIGISPFSAHKMKEWPIAYFEKLILQLSDSRPNTQIILFGGKSEENKLMQLKGQNPQVSVAVGLEGGMETELAIINRLEYMLCLDSANMHFASLLGVKTFPIFGPTHPFLGFGPWGQLENVIQIEELNCRPCSVFGNKACYRKDHACLRELSEEKVFQKIEELN